MLPEEQFHRRFDIGPGSLHDTLLHIVGAMQRWSDRIGGVQLRPSPEAEKRRRSPGELLELLDAAQSDLAAAAREASAGQGLDSTITVTFPGERPMAFTRAAALVHVTTHGMHHRAQALNMLRQLGRNDLLDCIDVLDWSLAQESAGA